MGRVFNEMGNKMTWNIFGDWNLFGSCDDKWSGGYSCDEPVKCESTPTCDTSCDVSFGDCAGVVTGAVDTAINWIADGVKWFADCAVSIVDWFVDCTVSVVDYLVDCTVDCIELVAGCETVDSVVSNAVHGAVDVVAGGVTSAVDVVVDGVKGAVDVVHGTYGDDAGEPAQDDSCFSSCDFDWGTLC